ncbi:ExeM/NucH family extracellular endonuclease [Massilia sp. S19_KUP03_FR1]|uniref:ExeM/NucH family extracellular endonuclease n=1 Tax=Massilia sp. S19_KUP03_FR1 TaxID=3025503 RepID=UPI002FCD0F86
MTSLFDSIQSPGRKTVLAAFVAAMCASATAFAAPGNVVISQVYGAGGNAGSTYARDFIELFNRSNAPVNLNNMSVQYQSAGGDVWSATALGNVTLQPGQYFLVAESNATAGEGDVVGTVLMGAAAGKVALVNQKTKLPDGNGGAAVLDLVGYGSATRYEGAGPTPAPSGTKSVSRLDGGCTDTDQNGLDFVAGPIAPRRTTSPLNVCTSAPVAAPIVLACPVSVAAPAGAGTSAILRASDADSIVNGVTSTSTNPGITLSGFAPATAVGASASVNLDVAASLPTGLYSVTVNFTNDGGQAASCVIPVSVAGQLTIPQIQGSGATSAYDKTAQVTQGVVTKVISTGFFLQDPKGDGDPTTSDGLFVYTSMAAPKLGDLVRVSGTITEFTPGGAPRSLTEMINISVPTVLSSGNTITPVNIDLTSDDLSRYEGMLVRFTTPLTINGNNYLSTFGELTLSSGRREVPTNRYPANSAEAKALAIANDKNFIVLDDGLHVTPATLPFLATDGTVRSGDTISDLTGVMDFGSIGGSTGWYKLQPTVTPVISRTERLAAPVLAAGNVKVASANVLNFFTTFTNGGDAWGRTGQGCVIGSAAPINTACRGADNMAEFVRQRDKIVNELKAIDADAVGLMEIQNNGDIAATYLVEQLNLAIGSNAYAVVPQPAALGTDAIRVAMIYKPAKLTLVGAALSDGDVINNRAPMAATFKAANGGKFSVVVNHLKSKASCPSSGADADKRDGQGCYNASRLAQATRLVSYFLPQVVATSGDPDVLVIGDLNAHGFEDPINYLTSHGMVNEIERLVRPRTQPYSYVFDAESGYLDHALASTALDSQVVDVTEWHNNADEPPAIDYNLGDTAVDYYTNNAFRASDHDPVVVSLNLAPSFTDITSSVKIAQSGLALNRANGKYTGTVKFTNTSAAALAGPLHFRLDSLSAGVTLDNASGSQNGAPYITLPGGLAVGASVTVTTTFSTAKPGIGYYAKLLSGTF